MKVLLVNNLYPPNVRGGAERSVQLLAESLVRAGVEVVVATTAERAWPPIDLNGVRVLTLALANFHWPFDGARPPRVQRALWHLLDIHNPWMGRAFRKLLRSERPDVVHTNNLQGISVAAWQAARTAGVPVVHTLRDYYLACARAMRFRDGSNCNRTCADCLPFCAARRAASQGVAGVVGTSRFILDQHLRLGFFRGATLRRAIFNASVAGAARRKRDSAVLTFGYLGRLEAMKGIDVLLQAFAQRTDSRWRLLIAGSGPDAVVGGLRRQADDFARTEQVRFVGWTDAAHFLSQIDVLVAPSLWHEPLSRAVIEAQSNGVPVVASRRGGLGELVADGASGILFEPDEPGGLARAIDELLRAPELVDRLSSGALLSAERYRPELVASHYLDAYHSLT
jgi:glycosyltransferase involved in cell wall biosynthesis